MELNNYMSISHCLQNHPVLQEKTQYKILYLNVLEYFIKTYRSDDIFIFSMLENYKKKFLGKEQNLYQYHDENIKKIFRTVAKTKVRKFKFFTYRYVLITDIFFLCALDSEEKGKQLLEEMKYLLQTKYHKKTDALYESLYHAQPLSADIELSEYLLLCWEKNKTYFEKKFTRLLITANMSAGKSTLINSLVGKEVNKTMNDACTAKLHYIQSKAFEDGLDYEYDYELNLDADKNVLMEDNEKNTLESVSVGTCFRSLVEHRLKLCFIDTPGVNSSFDAEHRTIAHKAIENGNYDKLVYVINGEYIGTTDDYNYMEYITGKVKDKKMIFVLNKLDRFRHGQDDIEESVERVRKDIEKLGLKEAFICPVSAYAGLLAKKKLWGEELDEEESEDLEVLVRKFKRKEYDLSRFYSDDYKEGFWKLINMEEAEERKKYIGLLNNAGILALENTLFL